MLVQCTLYILPYLHPRLSSPLLPSLLLYFFLLAPSPHCMHFIQNTPPATQRQVVQQCHGLPSSQCGDIFLSAPVPSLGCVP